MATSTEAATEAVSPPVIYLAPDGKPLPQGEHLDPVEILQKYIFKMKLPEAYARFLRERGIALVRSRPVLGLPLRPELDSVWGATMTLWCLRPELERKVIAVQLEDDALLCLYLRGGMVPDPPVVRVETKREGKVSRVADSFERFLRGEFLPGETPDQDLLSRLASALRRSIDDRLNAVEELMRIDPPDELRDALKTPPASPYLNNLVFRLDPDMNRPRSILRALHQIHQGEQKFPEDLFPLMPVDELSFACVVCGKPGQPRRPEDFGHVVRWHLDDVPEWGQRRPLDVSVSAYLETIEAELATRQIGLERLEGIAAEYMETHDGGERLPKVHDLRPIRLAVQNVVVGLAALRHESSFDGLQCTVWQTCQVPHVNAHEANRGLAAMTLAEAFRNGGTMEIRFNHHPEKKVPASLRQYGRVVGVPLGVDDPQADDPQAISPAEARALFQAVTPMPDGLAGRLKRLEERGQISPERACFVLLAGIWRPIELDFILATSPRARSILRGGVDPLDRPARLAEMGVCRAALMLGTLLARLSKPEDDTEGAVTVVEDDRVPIRWSVLDDDGAVRLDGVPAGKLPRTREDSPALGQDQPLVVVPRWAVGDADEGIARRLAREHAAVGATLEANDVSVDGAGPAGYARLIHPDGLAEIDRAIEANLLFCRVGRA